MAREGHLISDNTLVKTGYRLLSYIYALYEWDSLHRDSDQDEIHDLTQFEDEEISENLVSLAALARACDDECGGLKRYDDHREGGVGSIKIDAEKTLTAREACNKIIHAEKIQYDLVVSERNPAYDWWYKKQGEDVKGRFKAPALILNGKLPGKDGKPWEARVEIVPFVIAATMWANMG